MPCFEAEKPHELLKGIPRPSYEDLFLEQVLVYDPPYTLDSRWKQKRGKHFIVKYIPDTRPTHSWYNIHASIEDKVYRLPAKAFKLADYRLTPSWEV